MKILILGANGMLGHALINELANEDIFVADLPEIDITKTDDLKLKIKECKPEVIINSAAYTDVDGCESDNEKCDLINGKAVGDLAKICHQLDIILVHYSTDYIFDGNNETGYKEEDKPSPINSYGKSKLLGEELLQKNNQKYYLIRTAWLFGLNGKNFVNSIIDLSKSKKQLKIVDDQFGNPTYTKDLAKATFNLLSNKNKFGIYHLVNSGSCNRYDLALKIKEIKLLDSEIVPASSAEFKRPAARPKFSKLINTKLPSLRPWQEAVEEYLKTLK